MKNISNKSFHFRETQVSFSVGKGLDTKVSVSFCPTLTFQSLWDDL